MRRGVVWAFTLPLVAGSVLSAHALAYSLVGESAAEFHGYLAHAPQLIAVLATLAVCTLALHGRTHAPAPWHFATLALAAFIAQEHLERLVHTGEVPWLLTRPEFLLGLALQAPAALIMWSLARYFLTLETVAVARPPRLPALSFELVPQRLDVAASAAPARVVARGPPVLP